MTTDEYDELLNTSSAPKLKPVPVAPEEPEDEPVRASEPQEVLPA
jgi:hypothetical protein